MRFVCIYACPNGTIATKEGDRHGVANFLVKDTLAEAVRDRDACLASGTEAWVEEWESPPSSPWPIPVCLKCGCVKIRDLFKGEYCPRCNDWC